MAWIESHQSLSRHRKTMRAAKLLKVDRLKLIGHLHELWWWAIDNADIDGRLEDISAEELAEAAAWTKDGAAFIAALIDSGFIDQDGPNLILHDWYEYAGKLYDQRELRRQSNRERQQRRRDKLRQGRDDNVTVTRDGHADVAPRHQSTNQTNLTNTEANASVGVVTPKTRKRGIGPAEISRWEGENPDLDIPAFVADYLNWSGSSKHTDKVQGFENQMRLDYKRQQFRKQRVERYEDEGIFSEKAMREFREQEALNAGK